MAEKYVGGIIPEPEEYEDEEKALIGLAAKTLEGYRKSLDQIAFNRALEHVWELVRETNRYIDHRAPWKLLKEGREERVRTIVHTFMESLMHISVMIYPFMPRSAEKMWEQLGLKEVKDSLSITGIEKWGALKAGTRVKKGEILFPRVDVKRNEKEEKGKKSSGAAEETKKEGKTITIEDFMKVELRTGVIEEAESIPKSEKLLKLTVDIGDEKRQVVAGIGKSFKPDDLIGKRVVVVTNLKPAKLMGVESQGMILAADDGAALKLVTVDGPVKPGALIR